jgi:hypothetical protein
MVRLVRFPLESEQGDVIVEVSVPETGRRKVARTDEVIETATGSFEKAMSVVRPIATVIQRAVDGLSEKPSEFAMKFGIKFTGEASAIIASTSIEGNCEVTVKWKNE